MPHQRLGRTRLATAGRDSRLGAGNNRIDRVGGQPRQGKAPVRTDLHQRVVARIGGAAAPGDKRRAEQLTATGKVQHRALLHIQRAPDQLHTNGQTARVIGAADAQQLHLFAVVLPGHAVDCPAIRQHQATGADGGQAARQQVDHFGGTDDAAIHAQGQHAHGRP